jgi:hypothetical protein
VHVIPEQVRLFLAKYIPSIGVLEILLLFHKKTDNESSASDISRACRMAVASVEARLEYLVSAELLTARWVQNQRLYRYAPSTADLAGTVDELSKWYSSHPVAITSLVFSDPSDLVRPYPPLKEGSGGR